MKRLLAISPGFLLVASVLQAAPAPDFWYVVPGDATSTEVTDSRLVQGIVIPTTVHPTIQATSAGSIIAWRRPDGTRQSFVLQGMSSFTFAPGPIADTTHVLFHSTIIYEHPRRSCCSCASWLNSVESVERLACVAGCNGCGCEGCVCSPSPSCPIALEERLTLVAHDGTGERLIFENSIDTDTITLGSGDAADGVQFTGRNVKAALGPTGDTVILDPESITLPGAIADRGRVTDEKAFFAWSSPSASVILEQPRSMPAPSFHDGTIDLHVPIPVERGITAKRLTVAPLSDECSVCGTHPNSQADLEIYDCVPGSSVCYRCITWRC